MWFNRSRLGTLGSARRTDRLLGWAPRLSSPPGFTRLHRRERPPRARPAPASGLRRRSDGGASATRRELYRRDQVLAATAATTHDWLWETDLGDRLTYSSQGVEELLGYSPGEVLGTFSTDYLFEGAARSPALAHRARGTPFDAGWDAVRIVWRHRDGHPVVLSGSAAAIQDEKGRTLGYRGTRRLVTDAVEREIEAAARERVWRLLETRAVESALQPIVSLSTGKLVVVEALARFEDQRPPDLWFRDAEMAGLTRELDELTFVTALALLPEIPDDVRLSVNASPELLMDDSFCHRLLDMDVELDRLVIEITEHARVPDYQRLLAALRPFRERGALFAIDDTGAGYASLMHVIQLRPNIIKLDRALIEDLDADRARRSLVTALVLLALDVGASVTGEGVETAAQLGALSVLGVDHVQGYVLARPTRDRADWQRWWARRWVRGLAPQTSPPMRDR